MVYRANSSEEMRAGFAFEGVLKTLHLQETCDVIEPKSNELIAAMQYFTCGSNHSPYGV